MVFPLKPPFSYGKPQLLIPIESQPTVATAMQDVAGGLPGAPADSTARFGREQLAIEADFGELKEQTNIEIWALGIFLEYIYIINIINYFNQCPLSVLTPSVDVVLNVLKISLCKK